MKIGTSIYFHRVKKKLTQEELSKGICSVSYLSKIENGKYEGNPEIVKLLCNRLQILKTEEEEKKIFNTIMEWLHLLINGNTSICTSFLNTHQQHFDNATDFKSVILYRICLLRYYILLNEVKEAEKAYTVLAEYEDKLSETEQAYFHFFYAQFLFLKDEQFQSLEHLHKAKLLFIKLHLPVEDIYLELGKALFRSNNIYLTIQYANMALDAYQAKLAFRQMIETQMLLGVCYTRLGSYGKGLNIYEAICNASHKFEDKDEILFRAVHNIGYIYELKEEYEKALHYYRSGLEYEKKERVSYLVSINDITKIYLKLNRKQEAHEYIQRGLSVAKEQQFEGCGEYAVLQSLYYKINEDIESYLIVMENEVIKYYKNKCDCALLIACYEELGEYWESVYAYKKSSFYYKQAYRMLKEENEHLEKGVE